MNKLFYKTLFFIFSTICAYLFHKFVSEMDAYDSKELLLNIGRMLICYWSIDFFTTHLLSDFEINTNILLAFLTFYLFYNIVSCCLRHKLFGFIFYFYLFFMMSILIFCITFPNSLAKINVPKVAVYYIAKITIFIYFFVTCLPKRYDLL